jgi:hypothetical protein
MCLIKTILKLISLKLRPIAPNKCHNRRKRSVLSITKLPVIEQEICVGICDFWN